MKVIKEKNFIIFENENGKISKLDMNTGIAYGVSGKALKSLNSDMYYIIGHHARRYSKEIFALRAFADSYFTKNDIYHNGRLASRYLDMISMLDKCQAIGYTYEGGNVYAEFDSMADFKKWFAPFSKAYKADNSIDYKEWVKKQKVNAFMSAAKIEGNEYMNDEIMEALRDLYEDYGATPKQLRAIAKALSYGGLYRAFKRGVFGYYTMQHVIRDYLRKCNALEIEMNATDLINHYGLVCEMYDLRKNEMTTKALKQVKDNNPSLQFEFGDYKVVIPTTVEEFKREGEDNRNCVGGYVDYVVKGGRFVVFVRHKDRLDESLVTCDIISGGTINQFHTFGNNYVSPTNNPALYEFKMAYQTHLYENWGK
jgi:hypothetical protein